MFRTYRGQNEFVHWIEHFEIAQKRLLASWAGLLDLSDLPDVGTAEFLAALTDEQRQHHQFLPNDEEGMNYQVTLREQTITNRRAQQQNAFPLSDNLMSLIFLVQSDLSEQERDFFSSMNIRQIAMPQHTYLQVKQLFLELFCVSRPGVADPNIAHRKWSSSSLMKVKLTKENKDLGSLRKREKKDLQVFTQKPISGLWAARVHTLSADCTADHSRKVNRRAMERKANVQDPASVRGQKEKVLQHGTTTSKTQLSGEKGKGKKGKKGMKGKDSGRAKEKATVKTKEENNFNNNLHKQMSLNKHHLALHKPPSKILRIFSGFHDLTENWNAATL